VLERERDSRQKKESLKGRPGVTWLQVCFPPTDNPLQTQDRDCFLFASFHGCVSAGLHKQLFEVDFLVRLMKKMRLFGYSMALLSTYVV
jgi:hypothetical protein